MFKTGTEIFIVSHCLGGKLMNYFIFGWKQIKLFLLLFVAFKILNLDQPYQKYLS